MVEQDRPLTREDREWVFKKATSGLPYHYGIGSLADAGEAGSGQLLKILSIGLPVAALVGAGIVKAKPEVGAVLMAVSAAGFVLVLGFNFFTIIPVVILGLAALLGLMSMQGDAK